MGLQSSPSDPEREEAARFTPETLVEFRAGKMVLEGTRVCPDPRKGLVRVIRACDNLVHFQWRDVAANVIEDVSFQQYRLVVCETNHTVGCPDFHPDGIIARADVSMEALGRDLQYPSLQKTGGRGVPLSHQKQDQIVFPDEAVFEKVTQSSGRVYILKFKQDDRKLFFWMQGSRREEDEQLCDSVRHHLNQPIYSDEELEEAAPQPVSTSSELGEADQASLRDVNVVDLPHDVQPSPGGAVQLADLQRILHGLGQVSVPQPLPEEQFQDTGPSFSDIFKPEVILPLLDQTSLQERLVPFLPEGVQTPEALTDLMRSPQFQQQLDMFTLVLRSGQLDWTQFGIDQSNYNFTVSSFLEAIEDQTRSCPESATPAPIVSLEENRVDIEQNREVQKDESKTQKDEDAMEEGL